MINYDIEDETPPLSRDANSVIAHAAFMRRKTLELISKLDFKNTRSGYWDEYDCAYNETYLYVAWEHTIFTGPSAFPKQSIETFNIPYKVFFDKDEETLYIEKMRYIHENYSTIK